MNYIERRIAVTDANSEESQYQETDFFNQAGPLIILGEPGLGKSEMMRQVQRKLGAHKFTATSLISSPSIDKTLSDVRIIIDGLDEVTAYSGVAPISDIFSKILLDDISNLIFTCRAADWQHEVNSSIILNRWKRAPIVGKLLPLNDNEIEMFIDSKETKFVGKEFLATAKKHDAIDMIRNPQMLVMFLEVVSKAGWPKTKTELYEETCKILIEEANPIHRSLNRNRISSSVLLETAGFICTQMILGNINWVSVDGKNNLQLVTPAELASKNYNETSIRAVVSTNIFRTVSNDTVEPSHRTIAEYLGARWLAHM